MCNSTKKPPNFPFEYKITSALRETANCPSSKYSPHTCGSFFLLCHCKTKKVGKILGNFTLHTKLRKAFNRINIITKSEQI